MDIIIAPIHETFFSGRIWMGLDIEKIKQDLITLNPTFEVQIIDFSLIANNYSILPKNAVLFYTASYNENYQQYIRDVILDISIIRKDVVLLPNLDQLFSFENKGYQELLKRRLKIQQVKGRYYGDIEDYFKDNYKKEIPFVFKTLKGALSSGVSLIKNIEELVELVSQNNKLSLIEKIKFYRRKKRKHNNRDFSTLKPSEKYSLLNFNKFFAKRNPFIIQDFIPGLECDYKVLIFGEKFFVFQRKVRENDFRASGSGKFKWIVPPVEILNSAKEIQEKMNVSFIALDLGIDAKNKVYLFELQGVGFGPIGLTQSNSFFEWIDGNWRETEKESDLEKEYANAIHYHIQKII